MDLNHPVSNFTAVIRWRGPNPAVEIETRHPGFATPEDAALFANAIAPEAPLALRLRPSAELELLKPDGLYVALVPTCATLWKLPAASIPTTDVVVANDDDFEPHAFSAISLPPSALGDYEQAQYAVLDARGSALDVVVEWDEADHLVVTVQQLPPSDEPSTSFHVGALPEA